MAVSEHFPFHALSLSSLLVFFLALQRELVHLGTTYVVLGTPPWGPGW